MRSPSKYMPHQGKQEIERRMRQEARLEEKKREREQKENA